MGNLFLQLILWVYHYLAFENLGIAILEISVLSRIVLYPVTKQQLHFSKKMNELKPQLAALKAKHKDNNQVHMQAQMELYKQHGVNPTAGCLPSIVQIVVLFGLFGAMNEILKMKINTVFLIWDMAKPDAYKIAGLPFMIPGILVIAAAATQYIQMKMMMPTPPKIRQEDKPKEVAEKAGFMESFAESQASMVWMFPLIFLLFGTQWPSGLALYWSTSSLLMILQQLKMPQSLPIKK